LPTLHRSPKLSAAAVAAKANEPTTIANFISAPKERQRMRQDLWRAGHAHAGVWLILALVTLRYVDEANLSNVMKWIVRGSIPIASPTRGAKRLSCDINSNVLRRKLSAMHNSMTNVRVRTPC
jgi:hypothetical protein